MSFSLAHIRSVVAFAALVAMAVPAASHSFYTNSVDPVSGTHCCSGSDCSILPAGAVTMEGSGFRIVLTSLQAHAINPDAIDPVNAFVPMAKVQASPDGNYHGCIWRSEAVQPGDKRIICFWAPLFS